MHACILIKCARDLIFLGPQLEHEQYQFQATSGCRQQGHSCSKTAPTKSSPVVKRRCRLTQVDHYSGRKNGGCYCGCFSASCLFPFYRCTLFCLFSLCTMRCNAALCQITLTTCVSAGCHQLFILRHRHSTFGRRAFSVAGPAVWNSLPDYLRDPSRSFDSFRRDLKTFLFSFY